METDFASAIVFTFLFLPVLLLVVFGIVAVMLVSTAMVYVKAGRPAWLSLIPVYSFVELLDMVGLSVWWGLSVLALGALSIAGLAICACTDLGFWASILIDIVLWVSTFGFLWYVYYRLSRQFGESGWYALGYIFLPFVFFPMLGFGSAKFKGAKKRSPHIQKNKLIVTGIVVAGMAVYLLVLMGFVFNAVMSKTPATSYSFVAPPLQNCYQVFDVQVQHIATQSLLDTHGEAFVNLTPSYVASGNCYGKDDTVVFFANKPIAGADAATFHLLGNAAFYAADAAHVYAGAEMLADANPKNFTDLGAGYAKGKHTVFYSAGMGGVLLQVEGADVGTFMVQDGGWYDAFDKNNRYMQGVVADAAV